MAKDARRASSSSSSSSSSTTMGAQASAVAAATCTVISPSLNEAHRVGEAIASAKRATSGAKVIVVDGGSSDETTEVARKTGVEVIQCERGRGRQMNAGARRASGEYLVFLHADSTLPEDYAHIIAHDFERQSHRKGRVPEWGAFAFKMSDDAKGRDRNAGATICRRVVEIGTNIRSAVFGIPYGDQGFVIKRETFDAVGGFDEMPFMEDYAMARKLRKRSAPVMLSAPVVTSARRWDSRGFVKVTLANQLIILGYHCGVPIDMLADVYKFF